MKIQQCEHCHKQFTWKEIQASLWLAYRPIKCRECGTVHKILLSSRLVIALITVLPMMVIGVLLQNVFVTPIFYTLVLIALYGTLFSLIHPYVVKYTDDY